MNLPTQIRFLIGGMRGTFRWSTQKFPGASRPHLGNNDLNFRLARVQLVPLEYQPAVFERKVWSGCRNGEDGWGETQKKMQINVYFAVF